MGLMVLCPKCRVELEFKTPSGIPVGQCGACHGLWLSTNALLLAVTGDVHDAVSGLREVLAKNMGVYPPGPSLLCSACKGPLRTHAVAGIQVEYCHGCQGVFLDRGELIHLASHYRPAASASGDDPLVGFHSDRNDRVRELLGNLFHGDPDGVL